ncbi:hypothetical protein PMIN03_004125 [Paraphaeosphaeria minitans]
MLHAFFPCKYLRATQADEGFLSSSTYLFAMAETCSDLALAISYSQPLTPNLLLQPGTATGTVVAGLQEVMVDSTWHVLHAAYAPILTTRVCQIISHLPNAGFRLDARVSRCLNHPASLWLMFIPTSIWDLFAHTLFQTLYGRSSGRLLPSTCSGTRKDAVDVGQPSTIMGCWFREMPAAFTVGSPIT